MPQDTIQAPELQQQLNHSSQPLTPLIVDIRPHRQYRRHRIPGSQHSSAARLISTEFPDRDLVLVGPDETNISRLITQLYDQGYPRRIQQLQGGVNEWKAAGLPLEGLEAELGKDRNLPIPWVTILAGAQGSLEVKQSSMPEPVLASPAVPVSLGCHGPERPSPR